MMERFEPVDVFSAGPYLAGIDAMQPWRRTGVVTDVVGLVVESEGPPAGLGDFCEIELSAGRRIRTQVVGFRNGRLLSIPLEETEGLQQGDVIVARTEAALVRVAKSLLGRVLDGFGLPMDGGPPIDAEDAYPLYAAPPGPLARPPIVDPLVTGIRAIDGLLPCGKGQRIGIFGGSGVGKSTLLGAMSRHNYADVSVLALIGERNREVRGFLEQELGPEGLARSVVICATSDQPAPLRLRAAFVALAVSEFFRNRGSDVLLVMDSVTRLAMAQREIGLAAGEPPSQKGYPPSVFNLLPRIFERAGNFEAGSITGLFTVLVEGDDFNEPICDAVRGILDGHVILSRQLGSSGHYPAIDILQSVSRLASAVSTPQQKSDARKLREAMAAFQRSEDLINLGAYAAGTNPALDAAIRIRPRLETFLRQDAAAKASREETLGMLAELAGSI